MPNYDFTCLCGTVVLNVEYDRRNHAVTCNTCGQVMEREFPLVNIDVFTPYYDEALDCDITGREDKKHKMKILGVEEAGDKVGGARNFDAHAPHHVKPLPPRGKQLEARGPAQEWDIATMDESGKVDRVMNTGDLETV